MCVATTTIMSHPLKMKVLQFLLIRNHYHHPYKNALISLYVCMEVVS